MKRVVLLAALVAAAAPAAAVDRAVTIGVRADAKPFVYRAADGDHRGFLLDLCREAVTAAGYSVADPLVEVTASDRFERVAAQAGGVDLLCDPTTITLARAREFWFTPIVFVASSTYMQRSALRPVPAAEAQAAGCDTGGAEEALFAGWVRGTTADAAIATAVRAGAIRPGAGQAVCPVAYPSHVEGIAAICGEDGRLSYYFGDADILARYVADLHEAGEACAISYASDFAQYEPYGLIVGDRLPELRHDLMAGIYAFFAESRAEQSFAEHFAGRRMSPPLATLFGLYRIPPGE